MAFQMPFTEEDFSCPVCHEIFKEPVLLSCSHSFCKACLQEWMKRKVINWCPICSKRSSVDDPPRILAMQDLCETFLREKHGKIDHKKEVPESLKPFQDKLKLFNRVITECHQAAEHIKVQAQKTERQMKERYEMLHKFLQQEEEAGISALREEEEQKSRLMEEKIEGLTRDISTLSNTIRAIEETTVERDLLTLQDPHMDPAALIDEAKHLGNLTFRVWDKMRDIVLYTPVILDPNTARCGLVLSDDLTTVKCGQEQRLPDNPERFDYWYCVFGSECFNSGSHSWDVEVGENRRWCVGVSADSSQRKGDSGGDHWMLMLYDGEFTADSVANSKPGSVPLLSVKQKPGRIRVQLDWNRGELSFTDLDTNIHLYTFTHTFTDTLFPFVYSVDDSVPLKMLPRRIIINQKCQVQVHESLKRSNFP